MERLFHLLLSYEDMIKITMDNLVNMIGIKGEKGEVWKCQKVE